MRHRLERPEVRTLVIVAVGVAVSAVSLWAAASRPDSPELRRVVAAACPRWTEC